MLGPALFLIAILTLTATVAIAGVGAFARAAIHDGARAAIRTGLGHALADEQQAIAAQIRQAEGDGYYAAGATRRSPGDVPPIAPLSDPVHITDAPPRSERVGVYTVSESVSNTTQSAPSCSGTAASNADDVAVNVQCAPWIAESRMSARITVTVYAGDPAGGAAEALASRTETATFRLFADAPYAALAGLKDGDARDPASDDPNAASPHEGDAGGYAPAAGPLVSAGAPAPGDTTIHVLYECSNGGAACPGAPAPPGDLPRDAPWRNGNR